MSGLFDFPWEPYSRQVVINANVQNLSYHDDFAIDFPGTPPNNFALFATGDIAVKAGYHQFCIESDDGSWLYVDNSLLINNQGMHSAFSACQYIQLLGGNHNITVMYFQSYGSATLEVSMDGFLIRLGVDGMAP
jgi:hypothetical protein